MTFGTAIVDPPWPYQRSRPHAKLTGYSDREYEPLTESDLAALPLGALVENVLLLWTTVAFVPMALRLVEAWGFEYVTQLYWLKVTRMRLPLDAQPTNDGWTLLEAKPAFGVGYWTRGNVEPVVIAKKAKTPSHRTNMRSLFIAERGGHSAKPEVLHRLVEDSTFPGPYLELFAREPREGWTQFGDQLPGDGRDIRTSLHALL